MSVFVISASARQNLLSRIGSRSAFAATDEEAACRHAWSARRRIAVSALALAASAQESVLDLMR